MSLKGKKEALRARLREARDSIPEGDRVAAAARIADRLPRALDGASNVMIFMSFGSEVPTDGICQRLASTGHRLSVPHIETGELVPVEYTPGEVVAEAVWRIREPAELRAVDPTEIDAVVTPGLGFDRSGYRIGYGGGFYDRLLRRCRKDALRIGIGFQIQVIPEVPHGDKDEPLQLVLTDRETIICR